MAHAQMVLGKELYKKLTLPLKVDVLEMAVEQNRGYLSSDRALRKLLGLINANLGRRTGQKRAAEGHYDRGLEEIKRLRLAKKTSL